MSKGVLELFTQGAVNFNVVPTWIFGHCALYYENRLRMRARISVDFYHYWNEQNRIKKQTESEL